MAICGIYKITNNLNGKSYIGYSIDIQRRWSQHKKMKYRASIYDAFKKYGIENFSFEVIEECPREKLSEREKYWITYYDTYHNGYNETKGGEGGYGNPIRKPIVQYDKEGNFIQVFESISEAERVLNLKPKSSNISSVCKGNSYESYGFQWRYLNEDIDYTLNIGKSPLKEVLQNASKKSKENRIYSSKKVAECDKNTHEIIKVFNSIREASEITKTNFTGIYKVCKGIRNTAGGYYWIDI